MQVGEYEPSMVDVIIIGVILVALKKVFKWFLAGKINKPNKYQIEQLEEQDMTMDEVQRMRDEEKRCLVVVKDKIYDLSGSQDLYHNNRDVFEAKGGCGAEWEEICARKYPFVGKILKN